MSRLRHWWRRQPVLLSLRSAIAAFRSSPGDGGPLPPGPGDDEAPEDDPIAPEPSEGGEEPTGEADGPEPTEDSEPPAPPPANAGPPHQKLMLYASAAIVVLIVIVIVALGMRPSRRALAYVPTGHRYVQVVDMRRFATGPIYRMLASANHPIAKRLEELQRAWNVSLRRDVAMLIDADGLTIFIGRLDVGKLREEFEDTARLKEQSLRRAGATRARIEVVERDVLGHPYLAWQVGDGGQLEDAEKRAVDQAFAAVGRSVVSFGAAERVERFLRCQAGDRDGVLKDPHYAAAYDRGLARGAVVQLLEQPQGKVLGLCLKGVLGVGSEGLRAAFVVLSTDKSSVRAAVRIVAQDEATAEAIEASLAKAERRQALIARLGEGSEPEVRRDGDTVIVTATVDLAVLNRIVVEEADSGKDSGNLILTVLAE